MNQEYMEAYKRGYDEVIQNMEGMIKNFVHENPGYSKGAICGTLWVLSMITESLGSKVVITVKDDEEK